MTPTPEQEAIVAAAKGSKDNLLISALAGAAKTSTLVLIANAVRGTPILSLAFNKRIAVEMADRLPPHVVSKTLNSVGHGVWSGTIGRKRLTLNTDKVADFVKAEIEALPQAERGEAWDQFGDCIRMIREAKTEGYIPDAFTHGKRLVESEEFFASRAEEPSDWMVQTVDSVLIKSIKAAYDGEVDFDDQIYMPTLFGGTWPRFPLVMVDEAQDLSPLNHIMLRHLAKTRLIAVGDPNQSIYGFRGAVSDGMTHLRQTFDMRELHLTVSFRCPVSVVELARSRAPHMKYPEWAKPGEVRHLSEWKPLDVPDGAAIICRNNAPIMRCAMAFIQAGRGVKIVGTDIGPQLIKALRKLGDGDMTREEVHKAIDKWEADKLRKSRSKGATKDRANCLRVFADFGETLAGAIAYAEHMFSANGPVQFMTGHKAKGLEFDDVWFLDPHLVGMYGQEGEAGEQENNLRYVIQTRAKSTLTHVVLDQLEI